MEIPYFDLGGTGLPLHFIHANGYPPACYQPLFEHLQPQYHVFGMYLRPLWQDAKRDGLKDWHPFSEDLLDFLSQRGSDPVVGVGHSIGGIVTLRAAMRDPQKFRALILLDPVLFAPSFLIAWNLARAVGMGDKLHPLIKSARKRRREFDDLDLIFRGYRTRSIFRYMSDEALKAYINGIAKPKVGGGYELAYTPEWEAHIYLTGLRDFDLWRGLPKFEIPTLIIRGAETDTFTADTANLVRRKQPKIKIETLEKSTHILPLERPQEVSKIINTFLNETLNLESERKP